MLPSVIANDLPAGRQAEGVKFATKLGGIRPDESRRLFGGQSAFFSEIAASQKALLAMTVFIELARTYETASNRIYEF